MMTPSFFLTAHAIKHNHKPTATPPSTVIAAADNRFLHPLDNDDDIDANPSDLMVKYDSGGKKKGKVGHCCRYRDDNGIEALHGLYEEPKDDNDGIHDNESDWNGTEEK